ncbi:MAG TPA: DUF2203 domain-containing protein [Candidatus Angelobacter sp.]|nr:DUF2203 domain-containing protein [Candidatus Angelobacter sp.]
MPKMKTFTPAQAQNLLPVLRSLLKTAMDGKQLIAEIDKEFQDLRHRILLTGGLFVNVGGVARRRAQHDKVMQETKDAIAEINSIGVQVKDLDIGLLDFPCVVEDRVVLLCWKYGEEQIEYWHGVEEGFQGRKPLDQRILRSKKREKPN